MYEAFVTIFIFVAVMVVAAFVFFGWLVVVVIRGLARAFLPKALTAPVEANGTMRCRHERCRAENPADARFCRRCGKIMNESRPMEMGRAAMF